MLLAVAVLLVLLLFRLVLPGSTPRIRTGAHRGSQRAIASLERVRLGGVEQWILLRGERVENPVVLFLHGGPGTSQLTMNRRNTRELEKHFVVVNWDQRGAGKSFDAGRDAGAMTVEQIVADAVELTRHLLQRFGQERLVLVGHSFGTIVGILAVARHPELFHGYVGIGQTVNMRASEPASYQWTLEQARARGARRAVRTLERMGPPPYAGDYRRKTVTQRSLLARFGGEVHGSRSGALGMVLRALLVSREYTLRDRVNVFRGIFRSMELLWPQLMTLDLAALVPEVKVPVFFAEGRFDHESPSEFAARYFEILRAPRKELVWFERSAHMVNAEQRDDFNRFMIEQVLPTTRTTAA